jgi:hypothetical protein
MEVAAAAVVTGGALGVGSAGVSRMRQRRSEQDAIDRKSDGG